MAMTWIKAGLKISVIVGHSLGELAGLAVSGMLSLRDCLKLVVARASLIQTQWVGDNGSMLAISATTEVVHEQLELSGLPIDIACYNSPASQVVAGETAAISRFERTINTLTPSVRCARVSTSHAFYSRLVECIVDDLDKVSMSLDWCEPKLPFVICSEDNRAALPYSPASHAREAVAFGATIQHLERKFGKAIWLEVGVNSPVIAMSKRSLDASHGHAFLGMPMTRDGTDTPSDIISQTVKQLWRRSVDVAHWAFLHTSDSESAVWLPPYQFDKTPFWLDYVDHAGKLKKQLDKAAGAGESAHR